MNRQFQVLLVTLALALCTAAADAQNPIQWSGDARSSIARAKEQMLPLMFWMTERHDIGDDDDLRDAQEAAFRDPIVAAIAQQRFVPVRVARNSRVLQEAAELGLPTNFGLYIAVVTPDGKVLDQIDPNQVASPEALAQRLTTDFRAYRNDLYAKTLKPIITSAEAPKTDIRRAVQTVWRLGILSADTDLLPLLDRKDLTVTEKSRLYSMLASFATKPCIDALLARAAGKDREAMSALARAEAAALEWLIPELPRPQDAPPTDRQIAAYRAAVLVARSGSPRPDTFWTTAKLEERARELERVTQRSEPVLEYWKEHFGLWR